MKLLGTLTAVLLSLAACKSDPPPAPAQTDAGVAATPDKPVPAAPTEAAKPPTPSEIPAETLRGILALEHSRTLGDDATGLIALTADPSASVRARAALAIGRVGLAEGVSPLLVLMDDDDAGVRAQTAFASAILVGSLADDEQATKDLRTGQLQAWTKERNERKDPEVREAIAWGTRRFGGEKAEGVVDILLDAVNDGDPRVVATAMHSFALLSRYTPKTPGAGGEGFVQAIRLRAADTNSVTREAATYALMRMKVKSAIPDMNQALEKVRPNEERAMAIRSLTSLEQWEVPLMRGVLMTPPEPTMDNLEPVDYRGDVWTQIHAVNHLLAAKADNALTVLEEWLSKEVLPDLLEHGIGLDKPLFHALLAVADGLHAFPAADRARKVLTTLHDAAAPGGPLRRKDASFGEDLNAALLHCKTAAALDKMDKKLSRVSTCAQGLERVYPAVARQVLALETRLALAEKPADKVTLLDAAYTKDAPPKLKIAVLMQTAEIFESGDDGAKLVQPLGARALAETDPILRSYGVKISARGAALLALIADGATALPGHKLDVVLEALDAIKKHKPEGAAAVVRPWTANPNHAVRARAVSTLFALDPKAQPIAWKPAKVEARGDVGPPVKVVLRTTRGNIGLELWPQHAPATVASFLSLAKKGEYNGVPFHRVIASFVSQGGDPRGDGHGGPGYSLPAEWTRLPYGAGTLGMAHAGKDTGGCQFFLGHRPHPHLDGGYTVFGRTTDGLEVVQSLQQGDLIRSVDLP